MPTRPLRSALAVALLLACTPSMAQEPARTYTPADFARYAPRNALDTVCSWVKSWSNNNRPVRP